MTRNSIETTREWSAYMKKGQNKGMITFWTYKDNVASKPKTKQMF
jgi:hypothetical protein